MLGGTLLSIHNIRFLIKLTEELREAIKKDTLLEYRESFIERYHRKKVGLLLETGVASVSFFITLF